MYREHYEFKTSSKTDTTENTAFAIFTHSQLFSQHGSTSLIHLQHILRPGAVSKIRPLRSTDTSSLGTELEARQAPPLNHSNHNIDSALFFPSNQKKKKKWRHIVNVCELRQQQCMLKDARRFEYFRGAARGGTAQEHPFIMVVASLSIRRAE